MIRALGVAFAAVALACSPGPLFGPQQELRGVMLFGFELNGFQKCGSAEVAWFDDYDYKSAAGAEIVRITDAMRGDAGV